MWCNLRNSGIRFPFYGTAGFLACSSIDHRKPHSKTPKTHLSTAFWSWHSRNVQKWKFPFFPIFSKFCFKKIFILWHIELLDMFLCRPSKIALKNIQNYLSLQHFEVDIPGNFQKWKFSFFSIFSKVVFQPMPRFLRSSYKLLRNFEISW